jgi:Domain of Unknown Function (DUF1206)
MSNPVANRLRRGAKGAGARAKRPVRRAKREVKEAAANPWLERLGRLGYVVRGALYGVMGVLALRLALGAPTRTADQRGTLYLLSGSPVAAALLLVVIVCLAAYSLWGFIRAAYDPLGRGKDTVGIVSRLGFAWSGLNYAALTVFALTFLVGATKGDESDSPQKTVGALLSAPAGGAITIIAGIIGVATGLGQFVDMYKAGFKKDLKRNQMNRATRTAVDSLGRFGMFSRGVIFTMLGFFILSAGLHHHAADAQGIGEAFQVIARQPMGHLSLAVVGAGFIALGLHSLANARWVRMLQKR